jgi:hypothetical protein
VKEAQAAARALNPVREAMLAKGYMPEELFNRSLAHGPDLAGSGEYFHTTGIDTDSLAGLPWRTNNHDELSHIQDSFMRPNDIHYADAKNDLLRMYPTDAEARQSIDQVHSSVFDYRDAVDKPGRMAMVDKFLEKDVPLTEAAKYHIDEATAKGEYPPYLMDMVGDRHRYDMQTLRNAQREGVGTAGHYPGLGTERSYLDVRSPLDVTHLHEVANQTREGTPDLEGFLQWYQGLQNQRLHERASYQPIQDWLGSRGYDSLSRRTASGTQYAVPDKAQIYKPWMAPADATIPADYSGPFAARSAASPLGAAAAHSASVRISQENR